MSPLSSIVCIIGTQYVTVKDYTLLNIIGTSDIGRYCVCVCVFKSSFIELVLNLNRQYFLD